MSSRAQPIALAILAALSTASPPAAADETAPPSGQASLVIVPTADLSKASSDLGREIQQAAAALGKEAQLSALALDDLLLAVGCSAQTPLCLQKIGRSIQTAGLILARLRQTKSGASLSLRWFEVKSGRDAGEAQSAVSDDDAKRPAQLRTLIATLFGLRSATPLPPRLGGLTISASADEAEVFVNGQARGVAPLALRGIRPGIYQIEAKKDGFAPWQGEVEVRPGQTTGLRIELESAAAVARRNFIGAFKMRTWVTAAAALTLMVGGVAFGAHMTGVQSEIDRLDGETLDEIHRMQELQTVGRRDAVVANILLSVGGAALLASVVLGILDHHTTRARFQPIYERDDSRPIQVIQLMAGPSSIGLRLDY